ncbi:MAG: 30S ribosomal protein S6 [bacterium]|nr:30S ribosomal protein S6 [bacterium]
MYPYESVLIVDPIVKDEDVGKLLETLKDLIYNSQGELEEVEEWGVKRLAYPVLKRTEGRYILLKFKTNPQSISTLEEKFKLSEHIIKYLTVRRELLEGKPVAESEKQ